jgi:hypothetical protein
MGGRGGHRPSLSHTAWLLREHHDMGTTEDASPTADVTSRFAVDALLRRHGFVILERKGTLSPVWTRELERLRD